jgi:hypothetical protein
VWDSGFADPIDAIAEIRFPLCSSNIATRRWMLRILGCCFAAADIVADNADNGSRLMADGPRGTSSLHRHRRHVHKRTSTCAMQRDATSPGTTRIGSQVAVQPVALTKYTSRLVSGCAREKSHERSVGRLENRLIRIYDDDSAFSTQKRIAGDFPSRRLDDITNPGTRKRLAGNCREFARLADRG